MKRSAVVLLLLWTGAATAAEVRRTSVAASDGAALAEWQARVDRMRAAGELASRQTRDDTMLAGRRHERLAQFHKGVPVFGGELVVQSDAAQVLSVFGTLYEGIELDVTPKLRAADVERVLSGLGAHPFGLDPGPRLTILPTDDGGYRLTYRIRAALGGTEFRVRQYFLDAITGEVVLDYNDLQAQSVGAARGVLNDEKKISVRSTGSGYVADDKLRPPVIVTYDFKGDIFKLLALDSIAQLQASDLAFDADNSWTDGANVDAHVYAGYVYDYYFKRHGRRGLNNANIPITSITHPVRREDIFRSPNIDYIGDLYLNAFYAGDGLMVYGEGLPTGLRTTDGLSWNYFSGALDIVGHELSHGVTDYSSQLIYRNESGALNESFSDMMGVSVEFYYQAAGSGPLRADYLIAEDIATPGGFRSMQNPAAFGDPDHYSLRYLGLQDNGGVHTNSGISNNAFYLAIEGGTNRVSGIAVSGVGGSNREQIEKVFYRAFTAFLTPSATFSQARAASIQAARELYGTGGAVERAVTQAWTAVGVN